MKDCDDILELISCMIDGELSRTELFEVREHIASCQKCRETYEAFDAVSRLIADDLAEPPANFTENVMAGLKRKNQKNKVIFLRRYVGLAACLAILIGASYVFANSGFGGSSSNDSTADFSVLYSTEDAALPEEGTTESAETEDDMGRAAPFSILEGSDEEEDAAYNEAAGGVAIYGMPAVSIETKSGRDISIDSQEMILELYELLSYKELAENTPEGEADYVMTDSQGVLIKIWLTGDGIVCQQDSAVFYAQGDRDELSELLGE